MDKEKTNELLMLIDSLTAASAKIMTGGFKADVGGQDNTDDLEAEYKKIKIIASKLQEEGIGNFDFTSDEAFKNSLSEFLKEMAV